MNKREIKFSEAIREAIDQSMERDESVFIIGEGVPDPKGIFGTTIGLQKKYGAKRVLDMPVSENGMTGICIGAALCGFRPILVHQRLDFALLSLDQIINNAAKWYYMFGGQLNVPIVIRLIVGRGWGQGPQHSQCLHSIFASIPGLKVVAPATAYDAKGLLTASLQDKNPVIFIEHRWLHDTLGFVPKECYISDLGRADIIRKGKDITITAMSYMVIEAIRAAKYLQIEGISMEIVDLKTIKPLDDEIILKSVAKTGRLLVLDMGHRTAGFSGEIIARVTEKSFNCLKSPPARITLPDVPTPTTPALANYYYPTYADIIKNVLQIMSYTEHEINAFLRVHNILESTSDVPDKNFMGPF